MDCEKFDQHVMDALYDELDELTHAALKRHMEACSRCASAFQGLRATRDVGILPLTEPSEGLEDRIFAAVAAAQRKAPLRRKALRALAWAGSHAMRPQLAMAALFVLVIGSSLLLLRPKPASMPSPVRVTERGVPAPLPAENGNPGGEPPAELQAPAAVAAPSEARQADDSAKKSESAQVKDEKGEKSETKSEAQTALAEARAVRQKSGCGAAVRAYDDVGARFPATVAAADAMWEAASCYKSMGQGEKARELYMALRSYSSYKDRAEAEIGVPEANVGNQMASRAAAAGTAAAAAPAPPAPPVAAAAAQKPRAMSKAAKPAPDEQRAAPAATPSPAGASGGPNRNAAPVRVPASADAY